MAGLLGHRDDGRTGLMTKDEALTGLLADLYAQVRALADENAQLRQALAEQPTEGTADAYLAAND